MSDNLPDFRAVENVSFKNLHPAQLAKGIGAQDSIDRLMFRLNFVEKCFGNKKTILEAGNIALLEIEMRDICSHVQDLIDVMRELATLTAVSIFRQEQGLISPPNLPASGAETPEPKEVST